MRAGLGQAEVGKIRRYNTNIIQQHWYVMCHIYELLHIIVND
jgi:hypothetical protein